MCFNISQVSRSAKEALNVVISKMPSKELLIPVAVVTNLAALYLTQPERLPGQLLTVGLASGGAFLAAKGMYCVAEKVKSMVDDFVWNMSMKRLDRLMEKRGVESSEFLDSIRQK